jgi:molecular chaperone DnaJ
MPREFKDYYAILGVAETATDDEIKRAYRKIAMDNHPDRTKGNAEAELKFKDAAEAYEHLSDAEKKAQHDSHRQSFSSGFPFGDIFNARWNGGRAPLNGQHIEVKLEVTFIDLFRETIRTFKTHREDHCLKCGGTGMKAGGNKVTCKTCKGSGYLGIHYAANNFKTHGSQLCPDCQGEKERPDDESQCDLCLGKGSLYGEVELSVKIPLGMPLNSRRLVLFREGNVGKYGGDRGNVFIILTCVDRRFERFPNKQEDLLHRVEVPFWKMVLGGSVVVQHPQMPITISIPAGCPSGHVERVNGAGLPVFGRIAAMGDLFVALSVKVPKVLSSEEMALIVKLKEIDNDVQENHDGSRRIESSQPVEAQKEEKDSDQNGVETRQETNHQEDHEKENSCHGEGSSSSCGSSNSKGKAVDSTASDVLPQGL